MVSAVNYLAHLFLAGDSAESLIGNLAGDFVKGPIGERFSPGIAEGIRNHRRIDAFTDAHPAVAAFRRLLIPEHGHYARVIADVFFDHFLSNHWSTFTDETLEDFLRRAFATMDQQLGSMPDRLRMVYPRMRDEEWLQSYGELEGMRLSLTGISRRLSRRPHLASAVHHLSDTASRAAMEREFLAFFPEVMAISSRG
jgi:acyl carrier protein phosphodiesterase